MIKEISNILTQDESNQLEELIKSIPNFNSGNNIFWLNGEKSTYKTQGEYYKPHSSLVIVPEDNLSMGKGVKNEEITKLVSLILRRVESKLNKKVSYRHRIKINRLSPLINQDDEDNDIHIDREDNHIAMVYYVNTSDGPTTFYNHKGETIKGDIREGKLDNFELFKTINAEKGKIAIFDGNIPHKGCYPKTGDRYVINFNIVWKTTLKNLI